MCDGSAECASPAPCAAPLRTTRARAPSSWVFYSDRRSGDSLGQASNDMIELRKARPKAASEPPVSALYQPRQSPVAIPLPAHSIRRRALTPTLRMENIS